MPSSTAKGASSPSGKSKELSWEQFQRKYLTREDTYKYEWLDGVVEKSPYSMDKTQLYILRNLLAWFRKLLLEGKVEGELISEADLFFGSHHRRPDICWLTDQQIDNLADGEYEVPAFVIEVISSKDMINQVVRKMHDYRSAGVEVVWHILPIYQEVHVYTGDQLDHMNVCSGTTICSAAPALPAFSLPAAAVFERKEGATKDEDK
jgi:Uma2 family endonuclease